MKVERLRPPTPAVAGIFVGGRSLRMGGRPKGLLVAPSGTTIVEHLTAHFDALGIPVVLVGRNDAYASSGLPFVDDVGPPAREELGPLGGLLALLRYAGERCAIAVACDMPLVSRALLARLAEAEAPPALAVAPQIDGRWEPFFARYDARAVEPFVAAQVRAGRLALQELFRAIRAVPLPLTDEEAAELVDWDTPEEAGL